MRLSFLTGLIMLLLIGCQSTNSVVGNGWIQKRKYTRGYHVETPGIARTKKQKEPPVESQKITETPAVAVTGGDQPQQEFGEIPLSVNKEQPNKMGAVERIFTEEGLIQKRERLKINGPKKSRTYAESIRLELPADAETEDDDLSFILGIVLCLFGLAPFGVLLVFGSGKKFMVNLLLWFLAGLCGLLAILAIIFAFEFEIAGIIIFFSLALLSGVFSLASFLHGIINIIKAMDVK